MPPPKALRFGLDGVEARLGCDDPAVLEVIAAAVADLQPAFVEEDADIRIRVGGAGRQHVLVTGCCISDAGDDLREIVELALVRLLAPWTSGLVLPGVGVIDGERCVLVAGATPDLLGTLRSARPGWRLTRGRDLGVAGRPLAVDELRSVRIEALDPLGPGSRPSVSRPATVAGLLLPIADTGSHPGPKLLAGLRNLGSRPFDRAADDVRALLAQVGTAVSAWSPDDDAGHLLDLVEQFLSSEPDAGRRQGGRDLGAAT